MQNISIPFPGTIFPIPASMKTAASAAGKRDWRGLCLPGPCDAVFRVLFPDRKKWAVASMLSGRKTHLKTG